MITMPTKYLPDLAPPPYLSDPAKREQWLDDTSAMLRYIAEYYASQGAMPTYREIAEWAKLVKRNLTSLCVISRRIDYLEEAGYIKRLKDRRRSWIYTGKPLT